ncbi:uncharacterized protein BO97DRAFT_409573 [Aspergillus homomorphus CBS 101889]|uniref:Uncharacterized protein n=1 Tax=Aspergillus homomorphus (strain CBS 101889) TaxID=1450537 RepID=A0A395HF33_ASPHC|nr:hypothetical protein BO97DRAFT_409573 [Aspergillus homomorphus CBS 101889]RAL06571.1 hypothetical protein BO97DRAFT_409573 [Aspergillus homomorphus CBS 101889]
MDCSQVCVTLCRDQRLWPDWLLTLRSAHADGVPRLDSLLDPGCWAPMGRFGYVGHREVETRKGGTNM